MTPRTWTTIGWIVALALFGLGAHTWPFQAPWFYLLMFAVSEEAIFLLADRPTLSQRFWAVSGRAKIILAVVVAAAMVALYGHLEFSWFR